MVCFVRRVGGAAHRSTLSAARENQRKIAVHTLAGAARAAAAAAFCRENRPQRGKSSAGGRTDRCHADGTRRRAACMGGMLTVLDGDVRLVATTWEWAEQIDQARAEASKKRAEEILAQKNLDKRDYELAQARLKRALVRTSIHQ